MNWEEAFFFWLLGGGCGMLVMLVLVIWERNARDRALRDTQESIATAEFGGDEYPWDEYARSQVGEPDAPGPPKVVAIPKRVAKKKPTTKKAR